jgi:excisionase family DNA binding protein
MESENLLSIQDVAELTGLSVGTLYHWVSQRRIPVVRFSARCIRFRRADIESWLEQMVIPPD